MDQLVDDLARPPPPPTPDQLVAIVDEQQALGLALRRARRAGSAARAGEEGRALVDPRSRSLRAP
jgi:hypothetical protein